MRNRMAKVFNRTLIKIADVLVLMYYIGLALLILSGITFIIILVVKKV